MQNKQNPLTEEKNSMGLQRCLRKIRVEQKAKGKVTDEQIQAAVKLFESEKVKEVRSYDNLIDEEIQLQHEICYQLRTLIDAKWDSNTVKSELETMIKSYGRIQQELSKYD